MIGILLLIPLTINEMFDRLKVVLRATSASPGVGKPTMLPSGYVPSPHFICKGAGCHSRVNPSPGTGSAGQNLGSSGAFGGGSNLSGLEALAMLERQQLDAFNNLVRSRYGRSRQGEGWVPIEPGPSNPSRFFPELPKPRLSSGIALTTGPDDIRPAEKLGVNNWGRGEPTTENIKPNTWGQGSPVAEQKRENTWGKGTPVVEQKRENTWGQGTPVVEQKRENTWGQGTAQKAPPVVERQPVPEPEAPRIVFKDPPKARPTEQARTEKLIEVCGRMVPMSQAPTVSLECTPQAAPEPQRKPASENLDLGGDEKIFMP